MIESTHVFRVRMLNFHLVQEDSFIIEPHLEPRGHFIFSDPKYFNTMNTRKYTGLYFRFGVTRRRRSH